MGMFAKLVKVSAVAKAVQIARREAAKPENRQKALDAYNKFRARRAGGQGRVGT
jgi:hypothetical protein